MAVSQDYRREVVARLSPFVPIVDKSMFGGVGLYGDGLFFAVLDNDRTYFKVDDTNRPDFEAAGMGPFMPFGEDAGYQMGYYELPPAVLADEAALGEWVAKALDVARRKKTRPRQGRGRRG